MPTDPHNPPTDDARPNPPRYWWLKRLGTATGVLIVGLVVLRLWWGWEADRRLQAKIAEYHAAGQPVLIEDFQHPSVPDEENAAYFLTKAAESLVDPQDGESFVEDLCGDVSGVAEHADAVSRWIVANDEALRLLHESASRSRVDWKIPLKSPLIINSMLPNLSHQRALAKFTCTAAAFEHHRERDDAAITLAESLLHQSECIGSGLTSLISCLTETSIEAMLSEVLEHVTPGLIVGGIGAPSEDSSQGAERTKVERLISHLLDDSSVRRNWRQAMFLERLLGMDYANYPATWIGSPSSILTPMLWLFQPAAGLDAILMLEYYSEYTDACAASVWPAARTKCVGYPEYESGIERVSHVMSRNILPSLDRAIELLFRGLMKRRMTAVALAIRLYELDHGAKPQSLDQLVPEYLLHIPVDLFSGDRRSLGYRPGAQPPVLYSVGLDGVDDDGQFILDEYGYVDRDTKDFVFFLNGDRPCPPTEWLPGDPNAAEAVEDDGEEVRDGEEPEQDQDDAD